MNYKRLDVSLKRPEIRYTPKHGSRLDSAEIQLRALTLQRLDRGIPDRETGIPDRETAGQTSEAARLQAATSADRQIMK
ncbi:MAG: hypothetical protein AB1847_22495 [bacterium]